MVRVSRTAQPAARQVITVDSNGDHRRSWVAENPALAQEEFNKAFVLIQHLGYLRGNANDAADTDFGGYNFWLGKLNQVNGNFVNAEVVKAFILSGEYRQRFGP